jgi:hypothetical protein
LLPKKPVNDRFSYVHKDTTNPSIFIETSAPFMGFQKSTFGKKSHFQEETFEAEHILDLVKGELNKISIFDLAPMEVVNAHQWIGHSPIQLKDQQSGIVRGEEPALWDIASVDNSSGERVLYMRTHGRKDDVFRVATRINTVLDWARDLLDPWRDLLEAGEKIPLDELHDALDEMPPRFKFVTARERKQVIDEYNDRKDVAPKPAAASPSSKSTPERDPPRVGLAVAVVIGFLLLVAVFSSI